MGAAKVLLVEGQDEVKVLPVLCEAKGLNLAESSISLKDKKGYTELLKGIPSEIKSSDSEGLEILGIVIDADASANNRWTAVRNKLVASGYKNLPKKPKKEGTIIPGGGDDDLPTVGIWLMPNNSTEGMLETLIAFLVKDRSPDSLWQHAEQSTDHACEHHKSFSSTKKPKAVLHTWLAWQRKPGLAIGTAIIASYLDTDNDPTVDDFIAWIKRLFQLT